MAIPKRKTRFERQEEGRARILEATRELLVAGGMAGLSIRAIAARAGMPPMTLYGYFPNKTAIIRALWSDAFAPLFVEMDAAEAAEPDAKKRLHRVAQTVVDYWLKHPDRYRMVFLVEDRQEREDDEWFIEETEVVPAYVRFAPIIAEARDDAGGDYLREGETLLCGITGIVHMMITVSEYPWAKAKTYVDLLVRGFY